MNLTFADSEAEHRPTIRKSSNKQSSWRGTCFDDGTGRNVYFVGEDGSRQRKQPDNYVPENFENGERRYYYRQRCIRCRQEAPTILLHTLRGVTAYCLNICESCTIATIGGVGELLGNGDRILDANIDTPKHCLINLEKRASHPDRELEIKQRSKDAKYHVNLGIKFRRNVNRFEEVKSRALDFGVQDGELISWGFEEYDEYFGEIDEKRQPHGLGAKFYSDGSVFVGNWEHGMRHTTEKSLWQRPDNSQYEGTWVKDMKHGHGKQTFPDGSIYIGDWAKGYEHGHGSKTENDGSRFEGRFRFGKRDGPGQLTHADGTIEKRMFRDPEVFYEPPVPEITEEVPDNDAKYFEPLSLMGICIKAVGHCMHMHRSLVPAPLLLRKLPEYIKPWVAEEYLRTMHPVGSTEFLAAAPDVAFKELAVVSIKAVKFAHFDCEALLYFTSANSKLQTLQLTLNRLGPASLDMISKRLYNRVWPRLAVVDLSFNKMDTSGVKNFVTALRMNPFMKELRLSGCNINANSAIVIAKYLSENSSISDVDLSFNRLQLLGAEAMAECVAKNKSILRLNLRHNVIGTIGGEALAEALRHNPVMRELCVVDNKVGVEVMTLISGRLRGSIGETAHSVRAAELSVPSIHSEQIAFIRAGGRARTHQSSASSPTR